MFDQRNYSSLFFSSRSWVWGNAWSNITLYCSLLINILLSCLRGGVITNGLLASSMSNRGKPVKYPHLRHFDARGGRRLASPVAQLPTSDPHLAARALLHLRRQLAPCRPMDTCSVWWCRRSRMHHGDGSRSYDCSDSSITINIRYMQIYVAVLSC